MKITKLTEILATLLFNLSTSIRTISNTETYYKCILKHQVKLRYLN